MMDLKTAWEWLKDTALGFSFSLGWAKIMPEIVHGFAVILTGAISTVLIFFINRWLSKKFPKV